MSRPAKAVPGNIPQSTKLNPKTILRLLSYFKKHTFLLIIVAVCIVINAMTAAISALFMQTLIDDHIVPLLMSSAPEFSGLLTAIIRMAAILSVGVLAGLIYNFMMVKIAQGILKRIRDSLFEHMQKLPISYFDSHTHGDLMSHFTNDIDTLRQMIAQSLPHVFSSIISIISVLVSMLYLSFWLTLIVLGFVFIVLRIVKKIAGRSSNYFIRQQRSLGEVNGYIEEMVNGLKVIKVFSYEDQAEAGFEVKNEELQDNATKANTFANILMPIMGNLGYILYVLLAILGGIMVIAGLTNYSLTGVDVVSLGMIASFLT
ncbi:MAG: ABC transporter ATP-binding protein, partial [Clostridiaceae bacterium]|nr:ABC transporter ATP-binding protein [Clostridiaceae bacterium]